MEEKNEQKKQYNNNHLKYWVAYSKILAIGPINFQKLADYFITMEMAWMANVYDLTKAGIDRKLVDNIIEARKNINPDQELALLDQEKVEAIPLYSNKYPPRLKEIFNPPPVLYYRGSLAFLKNTCIAVIGTRKFSLYGRQVAEELTSQLAVNGITIISGLALGIDAIAHKASLDASGKTIAVLGSSVNKACVYPSSNRYLADKILATGGGLISEYPIDTMPSKLTFPMRNRIVSGLSVGTLIIEAPISSGSLITAKHALDQNREVFAVPGNIHNHNSQGTNNLIKKGAKMVTTIDDILEELNIQLAFKEIKNENQSVTTEEDIILRILSKQPLHIDKIKLSSKLNINALLSALTLLEIKGTVKDIGGKNYIKN